MNKIVRENYPVENLPDDLRVGLSAVDGQSVHIEIRVEPDAGEGPGLTRAEVLASIKAYLATNPPNVTAEEAVAQIRELRDEWEDR